MPNVSIPAIKKDKLILRLVGDTPLVAHSWDEKMMRLMEAKQAKKATTGRKTRNPEAEFHAARYLLPDGRDAFPAVAFKKAAVTACSQVTGVTKVLAKGAFHVNLGEALVPLITGEPKMHRAMVRLQGVGNPADLRYRPEYREWAVELTITYNSDAISADQIVNLLNVAGFAVGVGEDRPEKTGNQGGMFHVELEGEQQCSA